MRFQTLAAFLLLSGSLLGCGAKEDPTALTCAVVAADPAKYQGKRVTWVFGPLSSDGKRLMCGLDTTTAIGPRVTGAYVVEFTSEKEAGDAFRAAWNTEGEYTVTGTVAGLVDQSLVGRDGEGVPQMAIAKVTVPLLVNPTFKAGQGNKGKGKD
jgi:hypothetical protein